MSTTVFGFQLIRPYRERRVHETTKHMLNAGRELTRAEFGDYGKLTVNARVRLNSTSGNTVGDWLTFVANHRGAYEQFLYKAKFAAHKMQTLEAVGTGNGSATAFALDMRYIDLSTLLVYKAAVLQTLTTHYTVSGNNTAPVVTFVSPPGGGEAITATYDYYTPVRLQDDDASGDVLHLLADATSIEDVPIQLVEIAPGAHRV